jgi:hypothetical protein
VFLLALALALAGCGGEEAPAPQADDAAPAATQATTEEPPTEVEDEPAQTANTSETGADDAALARRPAGEAGLRVPARRARIVAKESALGRVLFDANGQVVYVFENDRRDESNCTSASCS